MVKIAIGKHDPVAHKCNAQGKKCTKPGVSSYPASRVISVVTTGMAKKNPAVMELMQKVSFTNAQMGSVLAWKKDNKASSEEAAVHFLTKYKSVWADWLNADAKKKLAAIIK